MIVSVQDAFTDPCNTSNLQAVVSANAADLPAGHKLYYARIHNFTRFCRDLSHFALREPERLRALMSEPGARLLLDTSFEGPRFDPGLATRVLAFAEALGVDPSAIILAQTNEVLERDFRASPAVPPAAKRMRFAWYHHFWFALQMQAERQGLPALGHANIERGGARAKRVLCLNATPRPHRLVLAHRIATHARRSDVLISFNIDLETKASARALLQRKAGLIGKLAVDTAEVERVLAAHAFDRTALGTQTVRALVNTIEPELYEATHASVVTETEMSPGTKVRLTEKSLKPLLMGHPLVLFGNRDGVQQLRDVGFDVFDDWIDHGYDAMADPVQRFHSAYAQFEALLDRAPQMRADPGVRERLHANVAQFEGPFRDAITRRAVTSLAAAMEVPSR